MKAPFNRGNANNTLSGSTYGGRRESVTSEGTRTTRTGERVTSKKTASQDQMSLTDLLAREEYESRHLQRHEFGNEVLEKRSTTKSHRRSKSASGSTSTARLVPKLTAVPGKRQSLQPHAVATTLSQGNSTKKFVWDKYLDQYTKVSQFTAPQYD